MKRIVLIFGLLSGAIVAAMFAITLPMVLKGSIDLSKSQILGFTIMILAFLLVFFGIRSYRDNVGGGSITFGKAFQVGILITLVACAVYVVSWEIVYFNFLPDFAERYAALTIDNMRKDGATDAAIAQTTKEMADFQRLYKNPLFNIGMTFLEIFPVGLIMTLVSAGILRRKTPGTPAVATVTA